MTMWVNRLRKRKRHFRSLFKEAESRLKASSNETVLVYLFKTFLAFAILSIEPIAKSRFTFMARVPTWDKVQRKYYYNLIRPSLLSGTRYKAEVL